MTDSINLSELLAQNRARLCRMIQLRLDRRLRGRVDASDVIQEAYIEATQRLTEYQKSAKTMSPFLWLRFITMQRLTQIHRRHLGVQARDPRREVNLVATTPEATSAAIAAHLVGHFTSPSGAAVKAEAKLQLQEALNTLKESDREILALRHTEQLTSSEIATLLEISEAAAKKRYIRALQKLTAITEKMPGLEPP